MFALVAGCGGSNAVEEPLTVDAADRDAATHVDTAEETLDAPASESSPTDGGVDAPFGTPAIKHVVVIVQENHSFDAYFGRWCTAPAGSNPTCTRGPSCCERAPDTDPAGTSPRTLDDAANGDYDPNHTQPCEVAEIDGGKMDHFTAGTSCADKRNFAIAPDATVSSYKALATKYAIADRYFQPLAGASSANDMYFAVARFVFTDNEYKPASNGKGCIAPTTPTKTYTGQKTIADLLIDAGHTFGYYAEGYRAMLSTPLCPSPPSDCTGPSLGLSPCNYDCSDVPFEYYGQFLDNSKYMKDWDDFAKDIAAGTLPNLSFIKFTAYHNEHPGFGTKISNGVASANKAIDAVLSSTRYRDDTLVLLTWDEGGGYFDHVAPPKDSAVDGKPYGMRVPLLAIGKFARMGSISHVEMEHSSVVKFVEYLFLEGKTGQLGARDAVVHNIGSLLDPSTTGVVVPSD
jgi:phospholipase C